MTATMMSAPDLTAVATAAARGDADALATLAQRCGPAVRRLCAALVDHASLDDLTQETFARAVGSLPGYRGEAHPLRWLHTIARRVCGDEIGRRQRARHVIDRLQTRHRTGPPAEADLADIADALSRFPAARRDAFLLTAVAGLSYAEAAAVCGCPVGTIRSRVARARAALLAALTDNDDNPR